MYRLTIPAFIAIYVLTTSSCNAMPYSEKFSMPSGCMGRNMCRLKPKDYPHKIIEDLLNATASLFNETQTEILEKRTTLNATVDQCKSTELMIPIYEIIDQDGNLRVVVQSEKFKQIISTEECLKVGRIEDATESINYYLVKNHTLNCISLTLDYRFLVLSLDWERLETAKMKGGVPVACSCRWDG